MKTDLTVRVLAIDPFSRGVGFAVFEGSNNLIDWGLKSTATADNRKSARVIDDLVDRFDPDVLVLEAWEAEGSRRCARVQKLLDRIAYGERSRIPVQLITARELRAIGTLPDSGTKYGRAMLLAERFPELRAYLPPFRKPWMSEDDRMSVFDAVGFGVAYLGAPMVRAGRAANGG